MNCSKLFDFFFNFSVPNGFKLTDAKVRMDNGGHGWFINPIPENLSVWIPFVALAPAILLFTLLFMETHICE